MVITESTTLPWPAHTQGITCAASESTGPLGPGSCYRPVMMSALVRYPRSRELWRMFLCAGHAQQVPGAEPLDQAGEDELADRRAQHDLAMAGKPYRRPRPFQPRCPAARRPDVSTPTRRSSESTPSRPARRTLTR